MKDRDKKVPTSEESELRRWKEDNEELNKEEKKREERTEEVEGGDVYSYK